MSKQRRRQARQKNNPIDIQWFTQDVCGDYERIQTNFNEYLDYGIVNANSYNLAWNHAIQELQDGFEPPEDAIAYVSYYIPIFPYFGSGGFPYTATGSIQLLAAAQYMYDQLEANTLNFALLGETYGGPPPPAESSGWYSFMSYQKLLFATYVMITNYGMNPYQLTSAEISQNINTVMNAAGNSFLWLSCNLYDEPDPGDPPIDYSTPYVYNGDPCDPAYTAMIDPETGNYYTNPDQISDVMYSVIQQYGQVGATYFFPDLNNDGLITIQDLLALLAIMPITCPYEKAPPPKITDSATMAKAPKVNKSNKGGIAKPSTRRTATRSNVRENLYTSGNEYTLPNGEIYVGAYHIHPTGGAMVGPKHTSAPHAKLTKLPPLKAQIPARSKGGKVSKKQTTNQQTTRNSSNGY